MEYQDIQLVCKCGAQFVWTKGEQQFMNDLLEKGKLDQENQETGEIIPGEVKTPTRCKACRAKKKQQRGEGRY